MTAVTLTAAQADVVANALADAEQYRRDSAALLEAWTAAAFAFRAGSPEARALDAVFATLAQAAAARTAISGRP